MNYLTDQTFMTLVNSRLQDHTRRGWQRDFATVAGELLDRGLVPKRQAMWDWARHICDGPGR